MGLNAAKKSSTGGAKAPCLDAGAYPGRLVQIIDLGRQEQDPYKGKEKKPADMIMTTYEILDEFLQDEDGNDLLDKPRWQSEQFVLYNLDVENAKSTKRYSALDPDRKYKGDWSQLIGAPCTITLVKNVAKTSGNEYNAIATISSMREKEAKNAPKLVNDPKVFDLTNPDLEVFFALPDWLQEKIKTNLDYDGSLLQQMLIEHEGVEAENAPEGEDSNEPEGDEDW